MDPAIRAHGRCVAALLVGLGIATIGAVRKSGASHGPETPACIHVALTADSIFIGLHTLPCPTLGVDTVLIIRMPSRHRECLGVVEIDPPGHSATPTWHHCKPPPVQISRFEPLKQVEL